jgi:phosphoribosylformylglycinamidine synthase subunit PurS
VRVGKRIEITVEANSAADAETAVRSMCEQLLSNPVIEQFAFEVTEVAPAR